jgi:hypothetical protein
VVTGAQVFDDWFDARPSRLRREFCRDVGLDPGHPFVLYVGSSTFIAPDEVPFVERWIAHLRRSSDPFLASAGVLVRPHPANSRQWRTFDVSAWPNVAVWPPIGSDPNGPDARRDYVDSLFHSGRWSASTRAPSSRRASSGVQCSRSRCPSSRTRKPAPCTSSTWSIKPPGSCTWPPTLDEHVEQLAGALHGRSDAAALNARFVRSFIRPFGADVPAVPAFVRAIESLGAMPAPPPRGDSPWIAAGRPFAYGAACVARVLAEDRPLWVYVLRPFVALWVWTAAGVYWLRTSTRERVQLRAKRLRRGLHRASYEVPRAAGRAWRRAQKQARRVFAAAHGADRRG